MGIRVTPVTKANKLNEYGSEVSHRSQLMVRLVCHALVVVPFTQRFSPRVLRDNTKTATWKITADPGAAVLAVGVKSVRNIKMYLLCSHGVCNLTVLFGLDGHYMVTMAVKT